jgi:hypothetical protein
MAPRFLDEGSDRWRMRAPADGRQVDRSGEAGFDQRPDDEVRIRHTELGEEAEAEASLDHALNPIVAR